MCHVINFLVTDDPLQLLVIQNNAISRVKRQTRGEGYELEPLPISQAANQDANGGLDYHSERALVFWSDVIAKKIYVQSMNSK